MMKHFRTFHNLHNSKARYIPKINKIFYNKSRLSLVTFNLNGTLIDPGVKAPTKALESSFKEYGLTCSENEIRAFMGMNKLNHINQILFSPSIKKQFLLNFNRKPNNKDLQNIKQIFQNKLPDYLHEYGTLIPQSLDILEYFKYQNIPCAITTTLCSHEINLILEKHPQLRNHIHFILTCDQHFQNNYKMSQSMILQSKFQIQSPQEILKIDNTYFGLVKNILYKNITCGVSQWSNYMKLQEDELHALASKNPKIFKAINDKIKNRYKRIGSTFAINSIEEIPKLIKYIDKPL